MTNPLDGSSSLSTPGLLLGTIASVGSGSHESRHSAGGQENGAHSYTDTLGRKSSFGTLERKPGKENQRPAVERADSFLNRSSVKNLESHSLLSSLDRKNPSGRMTVSETPNSRSSTLARRSSSAERKSLLGENSWLSLERRGKTSRDLVGSEVKEDKDIAAVAIEIQQDEKTSLLRDRSESPDEDNYGDLTKARSFWKTLDSETVRRQSQDYGSRRESQDLGSRSESQDFGNRRENQDIGRRLESQDIGKINYGEIIRESNLKIDSDSSRKVSKEPEPDYDMEKEKEKIPVARKRRQREKRSDHKAEKLLKKKTSEKRSDLVIEKNQKSEKTNQNSGSRKSSSVSRQYNGSKKRRDSILSSELSPPDYSERAKSPDYDRGRRDSSVDGTLNRARSLSTGRRGSDSTRRESDFALVKYEDTRDQDYETLSRRGSMHAKSADRQVALAKRRESNPDESQHFLSLQLFSQHAEPSLGEFLPIEKQLELEHKQREEEDALYRKFIQERREQEDVVGTMEEEERDELFEKMNKMERSKIINLADRHCTQMLDLIHREKIQYLSEGGEAMADIHANYPREPPPIAPPVHKKEDVYENNMNVFEAVDEVAKTAAKDNYKTFSNLVRILVGRCASELDKARAIFRYITEKKFDHHSWFLYYPEEGNTRGAPTSLLRGVEFGIETKALLYKRMCAYAGLHAIVIKGYCKAKDYKPAEEFVDKRWRNAWNAVYVAGGWRLVQPNWAAMQVSTKAARETRQIYQDHYFLTDADKFIFEFFPLSAEHQLLEHPITKEEFEQLPLLRSTFFHFGLGLARSEGLLQASVNCDDKGEANIYLNSHNDVSFHYTITNYKTGSTSVKAPGGKFPLGRFVMMSTRDEETNFNVHVPQKGNYLLEIGAAKYPTAEECQAQKPIYYINVCKFKVVCRSVDKVMVPLPDCVPGEWGPAKAEKLFGLRGTSHPMPVIYAAPPSNIDLRQDIRPLTLNIEFEKTQPVLDFVTKLYKNGVKEEDLKQGARYRIKDQYVIFDIKVPQDGQYGLDIYTRQRWEDKMLHVCKYLINCDV